jgi:hypothetical protein
VKISTPAITTNVLLAMSSSVSPGDEGKGQLSEHHVLKALIEEVANYLIVPTDALPQFRDRQHLDP